MGSKCGLLTLTILSCFMFYCQCSPRYNKYYYDPYQDEGLLSEGQEMCSLSTATLRTILRGLVAVLTRVFPECAFPDVPCLHRDEKKDEPIKVFRQIVTCPSVPVPYYPTCCPPQTQIPPPPTVPRFMHTQV